METLYMKAKKDNISKYVIFSGDPWRVDVFRELLDDIEEVGFEREYNTFTGVYKGVRITVTSTGMGAPSAAIAVEEMYECGMEVGIRMGTVMSMDHDMVGDFLIPLGSMRCEDTSDRYVEKSYPAIADFDIVNHLNRAVEEFGYNVHNGIHATINSYYTDMKESRFSKESKRDVEKVMNDYQALGILGLDMESSCMMTITRLMNVKFGVITLATVSKNLKNYIDTEERIKMEKDLCIITLDAIVNIDKERNL